MISQSPNCWVNTCFVYRQSRCSSVVAIVPPYVIRGSPHTIVVISLFEYHSGFASPLPSPSRWTSDTTPVCPANRTGWVRLVSHCIDVYYTSNCIVQRMEAHIMYPHCCMKALTHVALFHIPNTQLYPGKIPGGFRLTLDGERVRATRCPYLNCVLIKRVL